MIYFNVNIRNPWWAERFENIWNKGGATPFKNKYWEMQLMKVSELLRIEFSWTVKEDHAGVQLELALFGYQFDMGVHDCRHWDYKNNCWVNYDAGKEE